MTPLAQKHIVRLKSIGASLIALEALWDGDTVGWFIDLCAVILENGSYRSDQLESFRAGGDIRMFHDSVPPWPEAVRANALGRQFADELGIPFSFPSPEHPEDECPHWWQLSEATPCRRCDIPLIQPPSTPWRGVCYFCHTALEHEAREARWSPQERAAPRCHICGAPAPKATEGRPRCDDCQAKYRGFSCATCGCQGLVSADRAHEPDLCSTCLARARLATLSAAEIQHLRDAAACGLIAGLKEIRILLGCSLSDAQIAFHMLTFSAE